MTNNNNQKGCIGVLTSGGDAPGMNAAVRAVVRTALHRRFKKVFVIKEGYKGLVKDGEDNKKYIEEVKWNDVSGILHKGGTEFGTARWDEFREEPGKLKAARNLIKKGINRLIVIGGDGSLAGANELHEQWPKLKAKLLPKMKEAKNYPHLAVVGVVASIDNDMCDVDMTIGADTALHRISEAVDSISSTAASHQRIFVVETMGRRCGYLVLMGSLITGADWVIIPEDPPGDEEWGKMVEQLKTAREKNQKHSIIVLLAEGVKHCGGVTNNHALKKDKKEFRIKEIGRSDVKDALREGLKGKEEVEAPDVRDTKLGHVQRGGSPSAYDRILSTLLEYAAVEKISEKDSFSNSCIVAGFKDNKIECLPLKKTVEKNAKISEYLEKCCFKEAIDMRESYFQEIYKIARILMKPELMIKIPKKEAPCFAVLHSGAPSPGMNAAVRAAVRLAINKGYRILGFKRGFEGLIEGDFKSLGWRDVNGWASMGGAMLETTRTIPRKENFKKIDKMIKAHNIQGLLIIGGWSGYKGAFEMQKEYDKFNIPVICMPASINNNLPGTDICIGSDTALNNIVDAVDKIKESAVAVRRCFLVEVMGRFCGYLALMSGLATGAERVYMHEERQTLEALQADLNLLKKEFGRNERKLALIMRNENAHPLYDSGFITKILEAEGKNKFDARKAILGHLQQGGKPSPFDRILATRLADGCINFLEEKEKKKESTYAFIGIKRGHITEPPYPMGDFPRMVEADYQRAQNPWWLKLQDIASMLAIDKRNR